MTDEQYNFKDFNKSQFSLGKNLDIMESSSPGLTALSISITLYVMMSNIMLIYGLYKTNRKLTLTKKLFVYLSCVDLILIIVSFIITTVIYYGNNLSYNIRFAFTSISMSLGLLSFEIFWTISTIRYLSIKKPLLQINTLFVNLALTLEFLLVVLFGNFHFISTRQTNATSLMVMNVLLTIVYTIGLPFVLTLNMKACSILRFCRKKVDNGNFSSSNGTDPIVKRKRKAAKTLFIISIFYLICNLPLILFTSWKTLEEILGNYVFSPQHFKWMSYILWVMLVNTGVNATIYIIHSKKIRCYYKSKFLCVWYC